MILPPSPMSTPQTQTVPAKLAGRLSARQLRRVAQAGRGRAERRALRQEDVHAHLRGHHAAPALPPRRYRRPAAREFLPGLRPVRARRHRQRLPPASRGTFPRNYLLQPGRVQPRRAQFPQPRAERPQHGAGPGHAQRPRPRLGAAAKRSASAACPSPPWATWTAPSKALISKHTSLFIRSGASALPFAALLVALARKRHKTPSGPARLHRDGPARRAGPRGQAAAVAAGAYREMAALTRWGAGHAPKLQTICVHSRSWHEAGGNAVQELAFTLATGRRVSPRNAPARASTWTSSRPRMRFAVTVGVNFFMEIAKLRALRMLWSRAVTALGRQRRCPETDPARPHLAVEQDRLRSLQQSAARHRRGLRRRARRLRQHAGRRLRRGGPRTGRFQPAPRPQHAAHPAEGVPALTVSLTRRAAPGTSRPSPPNWRARLGRCSRKSKNWVAWPRPLRSDFRRRPWPPPRRKSSGPSPRAAIPSSASTNTPTPPRNRSKRPVTDAKAFHQRRAQQIASYRTSLEDSESEVVLDKLSRIVDARRRGLV